MTAVEQLQAAIAERRQQLAGLEFALAILTGQPDTATVPAKKPVPPVAPSRPEAGGNWHDSEMEARRLRIVKLLAERGPMPVGKIEVECSPATLRKALDHPWFVRVDPRNFKSPWTLTEAGRAAAGN